MVSEAPIVAASDVHFSYPGGEPVLRGVNVNATAGEFVCLLGANGSGKTTLLKCLLGVLPAAGGQVQMAGRGVASYGTRELARLAAYVPQIPELAFPHSVRELVLMGRYAHGGALGLAGASDLDAADAAMEMAGVERFADRQFSELSGGEAQCVMIARALAQEPSVLLLDEPTSHLDLKNQGRIYSLLRRLADEQQIAVVCVSHDVNLAARSATRLVLMHAGKVLADGLAGDVLTQPTLEQAYQTQLELLDVPGHPLPIVMPR